MHPDKSSLSIRLTEPVVPLRNTPERTSRHNNDDVLPPAILRGLLTLKLAKPTKISSIELELQAKATTDYVQRNVLRDHVHNVPNLTSQDAGPSRIDVTEQYNVHSASMVMFDTGSPQERRRATSTRPRVQFLGDHTGSSTRLIGSGYWQAQSSMRSASLDPLSPRARRRLSSDSGELGIDHGRSQRTQSSIDPAPPYPSPADGHFFLTVNPDGEDRSPSVASSTRITDPQSSLMPTRSSLTPDNPYVSPTSNAHPLCGITLSRSSSIEAVLEDESESSDASAPHRDSVGHYGLARILTSSSGRSSEQDGRGRSRSRFSFDSVVHAFEAVKNRVRSRSPLPGSLHWPDDQEDRGRSLTKGKDKAQLSTHGVKHVLPQIGVFEPSAAGGQGDQSGDGWAVFPEGTYTYPLFFTIPNNSPPTMKADNGSLVWNIKAEVKRPGTFHWNMTAQKEVVVICVPKDDDSEDVEGIDLQQQWEGQLQYRIQLAGRSVPIGGKIPLQLTIMPLAKAKVHSISVYLDERTEYFTRTHSQARSDAMRRATLLVIKHDRFDEGHGKPILPLMSDESDAFRKSPLYCLLQPGEDESEVASSLMGPGPWTIRHQLQLPDSCSTLHPSNRTKGSNVMVNHTLRLVLRVEKEEGTVTTGRKKMHDIIIHIPIQILSCHCTSEWTSLPRYDEAPRSEGDSLEDALTCPCARRRTKRTHSHGVETHSHSFLEHFTSLPITNSHSSGGSDMFSSDSLASRTHLHEQLISGLASETGEAPPLYERVETVHM
ncbi:hypothetical protein JVT61DRAFT_592 [Boletus reticuloceps]|uniref:Arrestin C-terminal-like domain-containing protein n=1 Tax=Boletus reticuloceps TaxID=495285 RepID=A0A8I2YYX5_9AGAM|nr:hypothetical protein JVT61DRAFT_592 [Boletus reticuloceps]